MSVEALHEQKGPASGVPTGRLVRRLLIAARWQFRRRVFAEAVLKAVAKDIGLALLLTLGGCLAPMMLVLTLPVRLGIWVLSPIVTPLINRDGKAWAQMEAIIASNNPPNGRDEGRAGND